MRVYVVKNHRLAMVSQVFRFNALQKALYHNCHTYLLSHLLDAFQDSFCSVNLDKVLAFTVLAVNCLGECLPVNYTATLG